MCRQTAGVQPDHWRSPGGTRGTSRRFPRVARSRPCRSPRLRSARLGQFDLRRSASTSPRYSLANPAARSDRSSGHSSSPADRPRLPIPPVEDGPGRLPGIRIRATRRTAVIRGHGAPGTGSSRTPPPARARRRCPDQRVSRRSLIRSQLVRDADLCSRVASGRTTAAPRARKRLGCLATIFININSHMVLQRATSTYCGERSLAALSGGAGNGSPW
jgi:hypothetical protein